MPVNSSSAIQRSFFPKLKRIKELLPNDKKNVWNLLFNKQYSNIFEKLLSRYFYFTEKNTKKAFFDTNFFKIPKKSVCRWKRTTSRLSKRKYRQTHFIKCKCRKPFIKSRSYFQFSNSKHGYCNLQPFNKYAMKMGEGNWSPSVQHVYISLEI